MTLINIVQARTRTALHCPRLATAGGPTITVSPPKRTSTGCSARGITTLLGLGKVFERRTWTRRKREEGKKQPQRSTLMSPLLLRPKDEGENKGNVH